MRATSFASGDFAGSLGGDIRRNRQKFALVKFRIVHYVIFLIAVVMISTDMHHEMDYS
jgi:hypothetical protein